jgi:signal transduction histidine kinase
MSVLVREQAVVATTVKAGISHPDPDALTLVLESRRGPAANAAGAGPAGRPNLARPAPRQTSSHAGPRSVIRVPLVVGHETVGLLQVSTRPRTDTARLRAILEGASRLAAASEAEVRPPGLPGTDGAMGDAALQLLASLTEELESQAEPLGFDQTLVRAIQAAVPALADTCVLSLAQDGRASTQIATAHAAGRAPDPTPTPTVQIDGSWIDHAIRTGRSLLVRVLTGEHLAASIKDAAQVVQLLAEEADVWTIVPLIVRERTIGAISFKSRASGDLGLDYPNLAVPEMFVRRVASLALSAGRLDEVRRTLVDRDHFMLTSAHDMRNVVAVMRMRTQTLQSLVTASTGADDLAAGLARLQATNKRLARLAADLVDLAARQVGQPPRLNRQRVDLTALVADSVADHQVISTRHELVFRPPARRIVGRWDAGRLQRVLDNLLQNAIRYSPNGGRIELELSYDQGAGRWAVLTVRDHGIGIPREDLPHVFTAFERGANARAWTGGSGIGLAAVKHIVEEHGGSVAAESTPGQGSVFTVRLPIEGRRRPVVTPNGTSHAS